MSEVFWVKLYCKMCDLFKYENIKDKNVCSTNIKMLWARNNIFKKRVPNYEILNHLYFGSNFAF